MKIPDIDSLNKDLDKRIEKDYKIFNNVLQDCCTKIKEANYINKSFLYYDIPMFINFGITKTYSLESCIVFVKNKLTNKGYKVVFIYPNTLYIDWRKK